MTLAGIRNSWSINGQFNAENIIIDSNHLEGFIFKQLFAQKKRNNDGSYRKGDEVVDRCNFCDVEQQQSQTI